MVNYFKKLLSVMLVLAICISGFSRSILASEDCYVPEGYNLIESTQTESGTLYYVEQQSDISPCTLWDVADMMMAGYSWAAFFGDSSWRSFAWAVLDTAALLPLLPSSAYFRQGGKKLVKAEAIQDLAKTPEGARAIKNAIKSHKAMSSLVRGYRVSDSAMNHILKMHSAYSTVENKTKFASVVNIESLIKSTMNNSSILSNYVVHDGKYLFQYRFNSTIGFDGNKPLNILRIITDLKGNVITAYPTKSFKTKDY